jgi:hypothetical protein
MWVGIHADIISLLQDPLAKAYPPFVRPIIAAHRPKGGIHAAHDKILPTFCVNTTLQESDYA